MLEDEVGGHDGEQRGRGVGGGGFIEITRRAHENPKVWNPRENIFDVETLSALEVHCYFFLK